MDINLLLAQFEEDKAISDVHLCTGEYITYRKVGEIIFLEEKPKVTTTEMEEYVNQLLASHPDGRAKLDANREIDFNFYSTNGVPYRINAYYTLEKLAVAMRKISYKPLPLETIMYDDIANAVKEHILHQKTGLFLVTWPTGSGKTTSLIAMIDYINATRKEHIVTIEDPIEFIFERKQSLISQRELGSDTLSFPAAMKSAMRQDPNIIFVGEIRDPETAEAAIDLAETGHLVFSTLHTRSASNTVYRLISFFPPEIQDSVKDRISASLLGVQSQFLLQTIDGKSRVGLYELMLNTTAVANNIRKESGKQIDSIIETSRQRGMISHTEYAKRLIADGRIDKEQVAWLFE